MKVCVNAAQLAQVLNAACKDKLRQECELEALQDRIFLKVTDGAAYAEIAIPAVVQQPGTVFIYVPPLLKLLKAVGSEEVTLFPHPELSRLVVQLPNEAQYLLPLGYNLNRTDNDNAFQSKVRFLGDSVDSRPQHHWRYPSRQACFWGIVWTAGYAM